MKGVKKYIFKFALLMIALITSFSVVNPSIEVSASESQNLEVTRIGEGYNLTGLPAPYGGVIKPRYSSFKLGAHSAYCIEFNVATKNGSTYSSSYEYSGMNEDSKKRVNSALIAGYDVAEGTKYGYTDNQEYWATQILVWNAEYGFVDTPTEAEAVNRFTANEPIVAEVYWKIKGEYTRVNTIPSFTTQDYADAGNKRHELQYNETTGLNTVDLTDTNNVVSNYTFVATDVTFAIDGNVMNVSTSKMKDYDTVVGYRQIPGVNDGTTTYWTSGSYQHLASLDQSESRPQNKYSIVYFTLKNDEGKLNLTKTSEDGKVEGMVFEISGNGITRNVTTQADGTILVHGLKAGTYTITEKETADRYRQPASQTVVIQPGETASVSFYNEMKKGHVSILKYAEPKDNGPMNPLAGATFTATSLDYPQLAPIELTTDENGYLIFNDLWYGYWKIEETKAPAGYDKVDPMTVFVNEDGKTYPFVFMDRITARKVRITKVDVETGQPILYPGTGFKIKDLDTGNFVTQEILYPTPTTIDEFFTNDEGYLVMPEKLVANQNGYELHETYAPEGYTLSDTPKFFEIKNEDQEIVDIQMENMAQKATISVIKTGENLKEFVTEATEYGNKYQPVYEVSGQEGAKYEIYAKEDIVTLDGTARYTEGELVATIVTDSTGLATSTPLYLGNYEIKEVEAPHGLVVDSEPKAIELSYQGQHIDIFDVKLNYYNERQHVELTFTKQMETNDLNSTGTHEEYKNVIFGVYAKEDIVHNGNVVVPSDGLIELATVDENGKVKLSTDFPMLVNPTNYYVKEIATDVYYKVSDQEFGFTVEYGAPTTQVIELTINDGKAIMNDVKHGGVEISKEDVVDGKALPNTGIEILNDEEEVIFSGRTDDEGKLKFDDLPAGNYYFREFDAPEGYLIDESLFAFEILEDGVVVKCTMTNELKPKNETPNTGDHSMILLAVSSLFISAIGIEILRRKSKAVR